jgi:diguanylate cyclase (GGDEF)-like protein
LFCYSVGQYSYKCCFEFLDEFSFMSLQRRLILAISLLLIGLLVANMFVTVYNARQNIYQQLEVHAQDTATSLGFNISQAPLIKDIELKQDVAKIRLMVDVIFDRGYYRRIIYRNLEGEDVVRKETPLNLKGVPEWFTSWMTIPEPRGTAVVSSGWFQLGEVIVVSHPGFAYRDIWRTFKKQLGLFLFSIALCYGLLSISLKFILRPLRQLEDQAEAVYRREFIQFPLPNIPELKRVAVAMNRMSAKVKSMFSHQIDLNDRLHQRLCTDEITGLANRYDFDERLQAYIESERTGNMGTLMLMQVGDLLVINLNEGRAQGDAYLRAIATYLKESLTEFPDAMCSRHSGADFAVFIPSITEDESKQLMEQFYNHLQAMEWTQAMEWNAEHRQSIYLGVVYASDLSEQVGRQQLNLLVAADTALSQARNDQHSGYHWQLLAKATDVDMLNSSQWSALIREALAQQAFDFKYQPIWQVDKADSAHKKVLMFNEVLTHLSLNDEDYPASVFMPMAMRLQLMPEFDRQVVATVFKSAAIGDGALCINISTAALSDNEFIDAVEARLASNPRLAARIIFELSASSLSLVETAVRDFAHMVKRYHAKLSLHHFGRGTAEFAFMQSLPLDYLKIDRCFIQTIVDDLDAQFFVRSLVTIGQGCDVMVLAEGVETEAQWLKLIELGIQGGQGFWLGRPQAEPLES